MTRYFGIPFPGYLGETGDYKYIIRINTAFAYLCRNMSAIMTFIFELIVLRVKILCKSDRLFFKTKKCHLSYNIIVSI